MAKYVEEVPGKSKKRIAYLDVLRMVAFVCIIVYHFMVELELSGLYSFPQRGIEYQNANMHIATFGVSLFFMISGAGLMISSRQKLDVRKYYRKRVLRILIPFYLVYFAYLCFRFVSERRLPFAGGIPAWRIIFTLLGMDEYFSMTGYANFSLGIGEWFLGCLMLMYFVFPLLRKCMRKNKWMTMLAATVYYLLMVTFYPFDIPVHANFFVKIYEFVLGMFFAVSWEQIGKKSLFVSVPVILVFLFAPFSVPLPDGLKITLFSAAAVVFVMQFEKQLASSVRLEAVLKQVRELSFEVFLVHHVVIQQFNKWFLGAELTSKGVALLFVIELLVMLALALLLKKAESRLTAKLG